MFAVPRRRINLYKGTFLSIVRAMVGGRLHAGENVRLFEKEFAEYIGRHHAVSVSSGTAALALILGHLDLHPGDEVIVPAYTCVSVPACIQDLGLTLKFVDINMATDNMDLEALQGVVSGKTKVIIVTHLFGKPCPMAEISAFAKEKCIYIIEDCAHSLGAEYQGGKVGRFSEAAYFSFSMTKPWNLFNGGMVVTDNDRLSIRIRTEVNNLPDMPLRNIIKNMGVAYYLFLVTRPFIFTFTLYFLLLLMSIVKKDFIKCYNTLFKKMIVYGSAKYKFTNVQALCGRRMLAEFDHIIKARDARVARFEELAGSMVPKLKAQNVTSPGAKPFWYYYVIKSPFKNKIIKDLLWQGIDTGKFVAQNCGELFDPDHSYSEAQQAYETSVQIPIEYCSDDQMIRILQILKKYFYE